MQSLRTDFENAVKQQLPFELTRAQQDAVALFFDYIMNGGTEELMILRGYAGTGKTTLVRAMVGALEILKYRPILCSPTGRAAKVLQGSTGWRAFTLHRVLYMSVRLPVGGFKRIPRPPKAKNRVVFVDESSMISDRSGDGILEDLLKFVSRSTRCRLILIGDDAQLPPVGSPLSPALSVDHIQGRHGWAAREVVLQEVVRQAEGSGILETATALRQALQAQQEFPAIKPFPDVIPLRDPGDFFDAMEGAFGQGREDAVLITRSNARATDYNQQIRMRLLGLEGLLDAGDQVMVVENNDRWVTEEQGFIANGDRFEVLSVRDATHKYGLNFAEATLRWIDYELPDIEATVVLDALISKSPKLDPEQDRLLRAQVREESMEQPKEARSAYVRQHPMGRALQLKFSYALTAHKAQGGQWPKVFIDCPYLEDWHDPEWYRWLYTALTRATEKVYLIGFPNQAFEDA